MTTKKILVFSLFWTVAFFAWGERAQCFDTEIEKKALEELFTRDLSQAFEELDADKVLSLYEDGAIIVTYAMGRGDKTLFRKALVDDFATLKTVDSTITVEKLEFENEVATAKVKITEKVVTRGGDDNDRMGNYYYRLIKSEGGWKITLQSYREDFGVTDIHGGPRSMDSPHK